MERGGRGRVSDGYIYGREMGGYGGYRERGVKTREKDVNGDGRAKGRGRI